MLYRRPQGNHLRDSARTVQREECLTPPAMTSGWSSRVSGVLFVAVSLSGGFARRANQGAN